MRMQIDMNNFFVAQMVPEIYKKTQGSKTARCVFLLLTVYYEVSEKVFYAFNAPDGCRS